MVAAAAAGRIRIDNITKTFINEADANATVRALSNVSLDIAPGEFVTLIGASGCGKSTLLRLIAGLIKPDSGSLSMDGEDISGPGPERGFAFQDHALFPWLTIAGNVAFGLKTQGVYAERKADVAHWIERVGLKGFEKYYPHQISGGMCQRAALARSLIVSPKVLLLDEPLGALDAFTRMNIQDEILKIHSGEQTTMIMVTHDVDEAVYMSDRVVVLSPRPGRIRETIEIDLARPRARSSADFMAYRKQLLNILHLGGEDTGADYVI
ncbi:MAG: ABC transporter ATP-binding protein [Clostridiales Family XIII bacterium]|jgi:ABC-type nitrate/sulfonate/bicarbonate transport system ATPase subunit|nr:ABC transporter ATP-binding protein [Clostridiales Family XIII bacterium]